MLGTTMSIKEMEFRDEHREQLEKFKYWLMRDVRGIYEDAPLHIDQKEWRAIEYIMTGAF